MPTNNEAVPLLPHTLLSSSVETWPLWAWGCKGSEVKIAHQRLPGTDEEQITEAWSQDWVSVWRQKDRGPSSPEATLFTGSWLLKYWVPSRQNNNCCLLSSRRLLETLQSLPLAKAFRPDSQPLTLHQESVNTPRENWQKVDSSFCSFLLHRILALQVLIVSQFCKAFHRCWFYFVWLF